MEGLDIDKDLAVRLFETGAKLIFLDAPPNMEFGIDFSSWTVGPKFKGIKFIPPGIHFVYYSSTDKMGTTGIRSGFFYNFKTSEVIVKRWNPEIEDLYEDKELDPEQVERIKLDVKGFDMYLGTYPLDPPDLFRKWRSISRHLSVYLLLRILQEDGRMEGFHPLPEGPALEDFEGTMKFTPFDLKHSFPPGSTGSVLTHYSIDKSFLLSEVMKSHFQGNCDDLLGELELSFIAFLLGQSFVALEQWKKLIILLCNCQEALVSETKLFEGFLTVVRKQLLECPADFFVDILLENNFLAASLQTLAKNVANALEENALQLTSLTTQLKSLQKTIKNHFDWDLEIDPEALQAYSSEDDEFAPVVVEL